MAEINSNCSFCRIIDCNSNSRESFVHLFRNCPITSVLITKLANITELCPEKNLYWYGIDSGTGEQNIEKLVLFEVFRFLLWKSKKGKRIPSFRNLLSEIELTIRVTSKTKSWLGNALSNSEFFTRIQQALG